MIVIFGIVPLDFAGMQKIVQNKKRKIWDQIGLKFEKVLSYFQHPQICQTAKFRAIENP